MRIRDWSSDVCSSDLDEQHRQLEPEPEGEHKRQHERQVLVDLRLQLDREMPRPARHFEAEEEPPCHWNDEVIDERRPEAEQHGGRNQERQKGPLPGPEHGRASWRERVWQYGTT